MSYAVLIIYILQIEPAGQRVHSWLFFTLVKIAGMAKKKKISFFLHYKDFTSALSV